MRLPREIVAHIAAWEAEATQPILLLAAGATSEAYDPDSFNVAAIANLGDHSFEQVLDAFRQAHRAFVHMLMEQPATAFVPDGYAYEWITAQAQHCREHTAAMRVSTQAR